MAGAQGRGSGLFAVGASGGGGEAGAAGRALEFLALGWFSLRQSRTMCPALGSGFAYGGELGRGDSGAGTSQRCGAVGLMWLSPIWHSKREAVPP